MKIRRKAKRLRKKVATRKAPNPLRVDPTRTATLRRAFAAKVKAAFQRLKWEVRRLVVDEDALGLREVSHDPWTPVDFDVAVGDDPLPLFSRNAFCPTGEGGGVDPTCSPGEKGVQVGRSLGHSQETRFKIVTTLSRLATKYNISPDRIKITSHSGGNYRGFSTRGIRRVVTKEEALRAREAGSKVYPMDRKQENWAIVEPGSTVSFRQDLEHSRPSEGVKTTLDPVEQTAIHEFGHVLQHLAGLTAEDSNRPLTPDETRLAKGISKLATQNYGELISEAFTATEAGKQDYSFVFSHLLPTPPRTPTGNARWSHAPNPEKIRLFQEWLRQQVQRHLTSAEQARFWQLYVEEGYRRGAGRAFDDANAKVRAAQTSDQNRVSDFYAGTKAEFLKSSFANPVAVEKVKLLAGRSFDDLEGVTSDMATRMSRTLTDGLVQGKSPRDVADDLDDAVDIGKERALTVARTELIRAHADGQLQALEDLGVEEVGVMVEWTVTPDEKVCKKCQALEGVVLKLEEAQGLIPQHPSCRCTWIPANVGEDSKGQKRSKSEIDDAFAEADMEDEEIDVRRPASLFNAFCPTGEGGGVDPTCSPGGGDAALEGTYYHGGKLNAPGKDRLWVTKDRAYAEGYASSKGGRVKELGLPIKESEVLDLTQAGTDAVEAARMLRDLGVTGAKGMPDEDTHGVLSRVKDHDLARLGYKAVRIVESTEGVGETESLAILDKNVVSSIIGNAFCPTGPGGGQDNSCSSSGGSTQEARTSVSAMTPNKNFVVGVFRPDHDSDFYERAKNNAGGRTLKAPEGMTLRNLVGFAAVTYQSDRKTHQMGNVEVHPDYRRQGLGTKLYDEVERVSGHRLEPSPLLTEDAQAFWRSRSPTGNAFCPTGEGGGQDNSCPPGGGLGSGKETSETRTIKTKWSGTRVTELVTNPTPQGIKNWLGKLGRFGYLKGVTDGDKVILWDDKDVDHDDVSAILEMRRGYEPRKSDRLYIFMRDGEVTLDSQVSRKQETKDWAKSSGFTINDLQPLSSPQEPTGNALDRFSEAWVYAVNLNQSKENQP